MDLLLLGFLFGSVCGLLLRIVLLFMDVTLLRKNAHKYPWETTVSLLFSNCQASLSIAGIVAIWIAFTADTEPYWLDALILCTREISNRQRHL
jgi:hypothetical protein